ncbi:phosphoglycerate mutase-like protein [Eremomyces bilateralis CBS 781.70]|uniref:Phosphoglycerate mutase-like protein n=1 Tax=Eremomyces bilateralis CBS 781.70 TaxID=1392243 RepID=A0A6G1FT71_9PEZI|nr:phosphoglycerate mutase-like protein [Eremomyces bilateralis CBS 781.70]KAF1808882.1 phosphoglycerate mutase-like protein [Eremomyces bilateralis CBS 781.70]
MRLYLIRHGETVDNVAQLYAGSRDSPLTNHGFQQATRLGQHLHSQGVKFSRVFSSDLQRAVKTAEQVLKPHAEQDDVVPHTKVALIREQDFGSFEGATFLPRAKAPGIPLAHEVDANAAYHVPMESIDSMERRVDEFLADHLISAVHGTERLENQSIAVVSHGITLSVMWGRLLARFLPTKSVAFHQDLSSLRSPPSLEGLGNWSNTGYLELDLFRGPETVLRGLKEPAPDTDTEVVAETTVVMQQDKEKSESVVLTLDGWTTTIRVVNGRDHLTGLKRTRGGVGSSRFGFLVEPLVVAWSSRWRH